MDCVQMQTESRAPLWATDKVPLQGRQPNWGRDEGVFQDGLCVGEGISVTSLSRHSFPKFLGRSHLASSITFSRPFLSFFPVLNNYQKCLTMAMAAVREMTTTTRQGQGASSSPHCLSNAPGPQPHCIPAMAMVHSCVSSFLPAVHIYSYQLLPCYRMITTICLPRSKRALLSRPKEARMRWARMVHK